MLAHTPKPILAFGVWAGLYTILQGIGASSSTKLLPLGHFSFLQIHPSHIQTLTKVIS